MKDDSYDIRCGSNSSLLIRRRSATSPLRRRSEQFSGFTKYISLFKMRTASFRFQFLCQLFQPNDIITTPFRRFFLVKVNSSFYQVQINITYIQGHIEHTTKCLVFPTVQLKFRRSGQHLLLWWYRWWGRWFNCSFGCMIVHQFRGWYSSLSRSMSRTNWWRAPWSIFRARGGRLELRKPLQTDLSHFCQHTHSDRIS